MPIVESTLEIKCDWMFELQTDENINSKQSGS